MLKELLAKEHILIRDCCTFMGMDDTYFRVTVRSAKDNQKLVETIKQKLTHSKPLIRRLVETITGQKVHFLANQ